MKIKEGFILRDIVGEKVIMGEGLNAIDFGKLLSLNETATWLFETCLRQGDFTVASLTEELCKEYEIDAEKAGEDIAAFLAEWQQLGIVEP